MNILDSLEQRSTEAPRDRMVVGTLVTGFYVIRTGTPGRISPVFRTRGEARSWLEAS